MTSANVKNKAAADLLNRHLSAIPHPTAGLLRLVSFDHDSDGLRKLRGHISEGLILLLEQNGFHIFNGLGEAISALEALGYTITPPSQESALDTPPEASNG